MRWTRPGQIHLTLNFLGSIEIARIPEIASALKAASDGHRRHTVRSQGLGCFPNPSRPQIIWAGLAGDLQPLQGLKNSIDARLLDCGCTVEDRPFHPHLTIGRAAALNSAARRQVSEVLATEQGRDFGEWQVERVDLMQSVLSQHGAAYNTLESFLLGNP